MTSASHDIERHTTPMRFFFTVGAMRDASCSAITPVLATLCRPVNTPQGLGTFLSPNEPNFWRPFSSDNQFTVRGNGQTQQQGCSNSVLFVYSGAAITGRRIVLVLIRVHLLCTFDNRICQASRSGHYCTILSRRRDGGSLGQPVRRHGRKTWAMEGRTVRGEQSTPKKTSSR